MAKVVSKTLKIFAVSLLPEAASAGISGEMVTEDHSAASDRTNGRCFIPQFKTSVLSPTVINASKTMASVGAKCSSAHRGVLAKKITIMVGSIGG